MALTNFIPRQTLVTAEWLNSVDKVINGTESDTGSLASAEGSSLVGHIASGTGSVATTVQAKLRETVSIVDKGADPTGVADSSPAVTLSATQNAAVNFGAGTWKLDTLPTFSASNLLEFYPGAFLTGAGATTIGGPNTGAQKIKRAFIQNQTVADEFATVYIRRDSTHTGGTPRTVSSALKVDLFARNAGATDFQWALQTKLENEADAGENVALYAQGIRLGLGGTWGAVLEARDPRNTNNPTKQLIGVEVDIRANGTDNNNTRIGIDVAADKAISAADGGLDNVVTFGVRLQSGIAVGETGNIYKTGFGFETGQQTFVGFDAAPGVHSIGAFKMAEGQNFVLTADNTKVLSPNATGLRVLASGVTKSQLNWDGSIALNDSRLVITGVNTTPGASTATLTNKPGAPSAPYIWVDCLFDGVALVMPLWLKA